MGTLQKLARVIIAFSYMSFFGALYTILKPFAYFRNRKLIDQARQLNAQAAKNVGGESVFVRLPNNGIYLHVVEAGKRSGKLVVLLHGFPDCWHAWNHLIPPLVKAGYFVVAPDMRGYNLSDKPSGVSNYKMAPLTSDFADLLKYYDRKSAILIAHDWGGVVAWAIAERYPELLEKLVIMNAPHPKAYQRVLKKSLDQALSSWYIFFFQIPFLASNLITYAPYKAVQSFYHNKGKQFLSQEDRDLLATSFVQPGAMPAMINYYKALFRSLVFSGGRRIEGGERKPGDAKIKVPTFVLWGDADVALTKDVADASDFVQDFKVQFIPGCSHWVPYERPDVVEKAILSYIGSPKM